MNFAKSLRGVGLVMGLASAAMLSSALAVGEGWSSDYELAKKQAAETGKDLLLNFTGSDWCGWCIRLDEEVFQHDAFKQGVKDHFMLVEVDFPRDTSKLSEETQKQNLLLEAKYAVQGYPTIFLCDASGRPYAQTGYQKGGPENYIEHLNELGGRKDQRDQAFAEARKTEGLAKAKLLIAGIDALQLDDATVVNFYTDVQDEILAADPNDETGYAKMMLTKKRLRDLESTLDEFSLKGDMDGALAYVGEVLKQGGFDEKTTQEIMMVRTMIYAQKGKYKEAIRAADAAIKYAPDSALSHDIKGYKAFIELEQKKVKEASVEGP